MGHGAGPLSSEALLLLLLLLLAAVMWVLVLRVEQSRDEA